MMRRGRTQHLLLPNLEEGCTQMSADGLMGIGTTSEEDRYGDGESTIID